MSEWMEFITDSRFAQWLRQMRCRIYYGHCWKVIEPLPVDWSKRIIECWLCGQPTEWR